MTATRPTIEDLGFPTYLAYDATSSGAVYLGIDRGLFDPAELIAALPPATDPDHGNWLEGMELGREWLIEHGVMAAYEADRRDRFTRLVTCPSWCEVGSHEEDHGDLLDSVTHRKTFGRKGGGEAEIQASQSYDEDFRPMDAGPMDRPQLEIYDIENGITDPALARFLASVLPGAADVLEAAQAEWDRDNAAASTS
jgi:hypothetical protein